MFKAVRTSPVTAGCSDVDHQPFEFWLFSKKDVPRSIAASKSAADGAGAFAGVGCGLFLDDTSAAVERSGRPQSHRLAATEVNFMICFKFRDN